MERQTVELEGLCEDMMFEIVDRCSLESIEALKVISPQLRRVAGFKKFNAHLIEFFLRIDEAIINVVYKERQDENTTVRITFPNPQQERCKIVQKTGHMEHTSYVTSDNMNHVILSHLAPFLAGITHIWKLKIILGYQFVTHRLTRRDLQFSEGFKVLLESLPTRLQLEELMYQCADDCLRTFLPSLGTPSGTIADLNETPLLRDVLLIEQFANCDSLYILSEARLDLAEMPVELFARPRTIHVNNFSLPTADTIVAMIKFYQEKVVVASNHLILRFQHNPFGNIATISEIINQHVPVALIDDDMLSYRSNVIDADLNIVFQPFFVCFSVCD